MEAKASAKYLQGSAQKARLVVDMIRGKNVNQALAILQFTNKRAADPTRSACARHRQRDRRREANVAAIPRDVVKACYVDMGRRKKRFAPPRPQGRAYRERDTSPRHRHFQRGGSAARAPGAGRRQARGAREALEEGRATKSAPRAPPQRKAGASAPRREGVCPVAKRARRGRLEPSDATTESTSPNS